MTDQSLGFDPGLPPRARARSPVRRAFGTARLQPWQSWGGAALLALGVLVWFWRTEGHTANLVFTVGVTVAIAAFLLLISQRVLFASVVTALVVGIIAWAAIVKRGAMEMVVHAYDVFFYFSSLSTLSFLWSDHRRLVMAFGIGVLALIGFGTLTWQRDATRVARGSAAGLLLFAAAIGWIGAATKGERRHMQFNFEALYVSSFYASWAETFGTLWHGTMLEALPKGGTGVAPPFQLMAQCTAREKPPHIVLVHQESIVQPGLFPSLDYDRSVDPMFRSQDGRTRKLRVETYGGASWLTEFSILAGVSTQAFGGMRQFVQTFTVNKLKDTLPQNLEACGYRNVVFYPLMRNFVSNDRFYASIGLTEIFDIKAQKAPSVQERDRFYYTNALAEMERHIATSQKPLFTYIQTMSGHWPYDWIMEPKTEVRGGGPGTHPDMHEYLRRVSMAKMDYDFLVAELKRRFPGEKILIVQYGDHQPSATRMLVGYKEDVDFEGVAVEADSDAFITYYAIDSINYTLPPLPSHDVTDIPYLGMIIQDAAGLPLSDANKERKRLMALCQGRYNSCRQRQDILGFHRRLIDAGIIAAR